jgi:hypothetical protein
MSEELKQENERLKKRLFFFTSTEAAVSMEGQRLQDGRIAANALIDTLVEALEKIGIAGNHLGLLLDTDHPLDTASYDDALSHYGGGDKYEIWCAWRGIREGLKALEEAKKWKGEV